MNSKEAEMGWSYTQYLMAYHVTESESYERPRYQRVEEDTPQYGWYASESEEDFPDTYIEQWKVKVAIRR